MFRLAVFVAFVAFLYLIGQQHAVEPSAKPVHPKLAISSI